MTQRVVSLSEYRAKKQEGETVVRLYPYQGRKVRAEPRPTPTPPKTAA